MTPRPDLNALSKQIVEANKAKWFHDKEYSNEHYLCLVISELMEAVEADRKELRANYEMHYDITHLDDEGYFNEPAFRCCIKDTVEDELADAIIRLLDLAGLRSWKWDIHINEPTKISNIKKLTESIFIATSEIFNKEKSDEYNSLKTLLTIEQIAIYGYQIDIWRHVELKLKYNATRERLHGKLY